MRSDDGFPKHLSIQRQLGRGAYGTVYLCEDARNGMQVAVKHIRHVVEHGKSVLREVRLLTKLNHENILHLFDFPEVSGPDFEDIFLVLPYYPTDLQKVIKSSQPLSNQHVQVIVCQIFRALAYLHAAGIAHRDLKPANILLTPDCRLRVCDFGLARGDMPSQNEGGNDEQDACGVLTEYVVTRFYRAPEVMLLPTRYTATLDIWSAGCILGEILGRTPLFPGRNCKDMIARIAMVLGMPSDGEMTWLPNDSEAYKFVRQACPNTQGVPFSGLYPKAPTACLNLLRALLRWDPTDRLTASAALEHEYLSLLSQTEKAEHSKLANWSSEHPKLFDWSFDDYRPTSGAIKERLYKECLHFQGRIGCTKNTIKERLSALECIAAKVAAKTATGNQLRDTTPQEKNGQPPPLLARPLGESSEVPAWVKYHDRHLAAKCRSSSAYMAPAHTALPQPKFQSAQSLAVNARECLNPEQAVAK